MSFETAPEALAALCLADARLDALWALPEHMSALDWGRQNIVLTTGNRKGPWEPDPYQVEIITAASDPDVRHVTFMKPAQVGWTLICQVVIGHAVHHLALPTMHIWPSSDSAAKFAKDRLEPMIEATPALLEMQIRPTSKNSGSTTRHKMFRNGASIFLASAGNPRDLRGFISALQIWDERSAWKVDLDGEGNPARIAEARGKTIPNFKIFEGSTPGALPKGMDPIDLSYMRGSRGRWCVPCPHCNFVQPLKWTDRETGRFHLVFERMGERGRHVVPGSAAYACLACGARIEESWKWKMSHAGLYVHEVPERIIHRSFHMNALSSLSGDPWELLAQQWLDAQDDPVELKTFITLNLGEAWEDRGDTVNETTLRSRADKEERPMGEIPDGAAVLTAFVDVQGEAKGGSDDYLFATIWAWGEGFECWLVDWTIEPGSITDPVTWAALDAWLLKDRKHATSGRVMHPAITFIDSGSGSHAEAVYSFVKPRQGGARRVFASKGVPLLDRGMVKEGATRKARVRLFQISNAAWKPRLFGMLQRPNPGPGYIHLLAALPDEFMEQLTSEAYIPIKDPRTGRISGKWENVRKRNEAWDCLGGSYCGLWTLMNLLAPATFSDLKALADAARAPQDKDEAAPIQAQRLPIQAPPRGHGGGFGGGFQGGMGGGLGGGRPW